MDGYRIMAESYKKAVEQGKLTEEEARPHIKAFELLGELTQEDLYTMVDTTAFNEIIKAYCRRALREASVDKNIEEAMARASLGSYIVLAEYDKYGKPICVKSHIVDRKTIKPDTFYKLENKRFVRAK